MKRTFTLSLLLLFLPLMGCGNNASSSSSSAPTYLESWNTCSALSSLQSFVTKATTVGDEGFIPVERRIAVFDMDGTLYGELFPTYLEYLMYVHRVKYDDTYHADAEQIALADEIEELEDSHTYPAGTDMRHARMAARAYAGMTLKQFKDYCTSFFARTPDGFENLTYARAFYQPMHEVVDFLKAKDFQVYVVSGSDRFLCRNLLCEYLQIPENRVIGMDVRLEATDQGDTEAVDYTLKPSDQIFRSEDLIIKNLKFNKVAQIIKEIGIQPVLSFGNSSGDTAMHVYTKTANPYPAEAYMLVADDDVRDYGVIPTAEQKAKDWREAGFEVVSMKNDFKTIYEPGVRRTHRVR